MSAPSLSLDFWLPVTAADDVFLVIGGVYASVGVISDAHHILEDSPGLMVRQPLSRYRNPLAVCDYHVEAAPYRDLYYSSLSFTGKGAAGGPPPSMPSCTRCG